MTKQISSLLTAIFIGFFSVFMFVTPAQALECGNESECAQAAIQCDKSNGQWNSTKGKCIEKQPSEGSITTVEGPKTDCVAREDGKEVNLTEDNCGIIDLLNTIFNFVSGGVALAVIANIIYAGIQYSMAQGDPSATGKSKDRIRSALIAFAMYLSLYAFLQWLIPGGVF